jgi:Mg2+-importing ATPase
VPPSSVAAPPLAEAPGSSAAAGEKRLLELAPLPADQALSRAGVGERGLSADEAAARLARYGKNEIAPPRSGGALTDLYHRIKNPLVIQLLVIACVSYGTGDKESAGVVAGMIVLSVALGYIQEARSSRAVEKLMALVTTTSTVLRDGREEEVALADICPGDLVILNAGSIVPADLRLTQAKDFFVSQSALTGEAMPIEKNAAPCDTAGRNAVDLPNAVFLGSNVLSGTARGVVVNTGASSYFGAISHRLAARRVVTDFDRGIEAFTWLMIKFMLVMVVVVFLIIGLTKHEWKEALLFSLAVAIGLTPEMLPMIVTVNLSKGALLMSKKKVIVKRLNSIQNFGSMDILCTDKTGTLTQDKIVLERHVDVTNRPSEDVLRYAYMNSYYQTGLRNLLDKAILGHSELDVERACRKVDEIPFDFQRRRMSVVIDYEGDHVLICKGAVEEIFAVATKYQVDEEIHPFIDMLKRDVMEEYEDLSRQGYRVLAIAYREFPRTKEVFSTADESDLILLGYIAFFDPPKESAAAALAALRQNGVATKILTGDNELVTQKVCKEVGLDVSNVLTGDKLRGLSDEELARAVAGSTVLARLTPSQKEGIIRALQRAGHVVGFMGDGINDAPALKAADVGISVDSAVDVAKEAADIVLLEKSLTVLEDGIIEGRRVFANIIKYIRMGASSNFGNMFSVVGAAILLPFLPMAPIQVLVNNLLYDFSQVGIPLDRVDDEDITHPLKWDIAGIKKFMLWMGPVSSIFDYSTFALMWWVFSCRTASPLAVATFHTGWFVESLMTQTLVVHVIRTAKIPFFQSIAAWPLIGTTLAAMAAAAAMPYIHGVGGHLGLVPLPRAYWGYLAVTLLAYCVLAHIVKRRFIASRAAAVEAAA